MAKEIMSTVILTKWGNSVGIRIPSSIIKKTHMKSGEILNISINKKGGLTLMPIKNDQDGWTEKFNAIADMKQEETLLDITNDFEADDWTW